MNNLCTSMSEESALLDDSIINECDLTEEAKRRFTYHTDIFSAYKTYQRRILRDVNISHGDRHSVLSIINNRYKNCKKVLNFMAEHNELLSRNLPIFGPVVICGLPRTGTTFLYNLLACDPHCRAPLFSDLFIEPVPPIARSNNVEQERRAAMVRPFFKRSEDRTDDTINGFETSHPLFTVEEDYFVLFQAGYAIFFSALLTDGQSKFSDHLSEEIQKDFVYHYHETFLRMLNSVDPPSSHWLLKTPAHLLYLDTFFRHYPNAALIMTHRSMDDVLPSFYRLIRNMTNMLFIKVNSSSDQEVLTAQCTLLFDKMVECLIEFRTRQSSNNIFDVMYDDLMKLPIRTVRRIYDHFGLQWSDEFEIAMQSWLDDNPQGKYGRHKYSLAHFGLTHEDIDKRYADYTNLFLRPPPSDNI